MTDTSITVHGRCDPRFSRVQEAFLKNFAVEDELGASFAAMVDGEWVVDIWGGHADAARTRPWQQDSLANVWSTTKAMTAVCAHVLVGRGQLDVEAPVARYWPEFAQNGKGELPVKYLLSHTAGLPGWLEPISVEVLYDWDRAASLLAAQAPLWEPGTRSGYHGISYGTLVGEVVRRISGKSVGTFFRDEVAGPLGADFFIGLPASEEGRTVEMVQAAVDAPPAEPLPPDASPLRRAMATPRLDPMVCNTRAWRAAEIPAANGQGNARSCATVMGALARGGELGGVRLMPEATVEAAIVEQINNKDLALGPMRWGLGFMLTSETMPLSPNPRAFGHGGWGGSFAMADLDAKVGLAYVMNRMSQGTTGDRRLGRLIRAVYGAL